MVRRFQNVTLALLFFVASPVGGVAQVSAERDAAKKQLRARSAGNRLIITANASLSDYAAYRSGERFYVVVPKADLAAALPMRALPGATVERRGEDVVFSFRLPPDGAARVNQRFNRLEIVLSGVPVARNERANQERTTPSRPSNERSLPSLAQEAEATLRETPSASAAPSEAAAGLGELPGSANSSSAPAEPAASPDVRASNRHVNRAPTLRLLIVLATALVIFALAWRALRARRKRRLVEGEAPSEPSIRIAESAAVENETANVPHWIAPETAEDAGEKTTVHRLVSDEPRIGPLQAETAVSEAPRGEGVAAQRLEEASPASDEASFHHVIDEQEAAYRTLCAAFDDVSPERCADAALALARLAEERRTSRAELFARAVREADAERRARIGEAIALSGLADEALAQLTSEREAPEAFALLFVMAKTGVLAPLLRAVREDESNEVRLAIVRLLSLCDHPDVLPRLRDLAAQASLPADVRLAVMEAIYQQSSARVRSAAG